jgi:hypothetical protein
MIDDLIEMIDEEEERFARQRSKRKVEIADYGNNRL